MLDQHLIAKTRPVADSENIIISGDVRVTVLSDRLFRAEKSPEGFCDEATQAVWFRDMAPVGHSVSEKPGRICIRTEAVELVLNTADLSGHVRLGNEKVPICNCGNLLGTYRTLDGCDGGTYIPYDGSSPYDITLENGVVARSGVAVFDDSQSLILRADGTLAVRSIAEKDIYIFAYGHDYRGALRALYLICGATPLIPRYALGNWWSRYYAYTERQYLHLLDRFTDRDIPLTIATIDMDWHWSVTLDERKGITLSGRNDEYHGGADGWTGYSWNTDLFPDYRAFLNKIKERGLRITLNLHPALGVRWFEDMYSGMAQAVGIDPATEKQVKFDMADDRFINAYFSVLHKPYEHDGVDFWWIDWQQGTQSALTGLDPLWALNHYHTLDIAKEKEPLILSRYCGIGSHRYPLGFSGDTYVTWKTLKYMPYFTATASNAGYTWWSHDIGGHQRGAKDDELYVRFVQFGVFSPINRLHCTSSEVFSKEPVMYMNGSGRIAEDFLRLRHRMIPLLYSASVDTHEAGRALCEQMYYECPEEDAAYDCPQQYLFAGNLIVAPVCSQTDKSGMAKTNVWLPEGAWTDLFTGDEYRGGRWVKMYRWLDSLPVLAKEGAVVVFDHNKHGNSIENPQILDALVYNGTGGYTLHEEENGVRKDTVFHSVDDTGATADGVDEAGTKKGGAGTKHCQKLTIEPAVSRILHLEFRNITEGSVTVTKDGQTVDAAADHEDFLTVELSVEAGAKYEVRVSYEKDAARKAYERIRYNLLRFEVRTAVKDELYGALCTALEHGKKNGVKKSEMKKIIAGADMPGRYRKRLAESLGL